MYPPKRIEPQPGQESVWDYPRPPRLESVTEQIRIIFNGETIADTMAAYRILAQDFSRTVIMSVGERTGEGGGVFQSDRAAEQLTTAQLDAATGPAAAITWTLVPLGTETRIGIDRDGEAAARVLLATALGRRRLASSRREDQQCEYQ